MALRYFNVYGPRQDPSSPYSGVLSLFMKAVLERRVPTIFGDGEQSRDFTYVEDVADFNLKAARARGVSGKVYNGGNGGRITLNQAWDAGAEDRRGPDSGRLRTAAGRATSTIRKPTHGRRPRSGPFAALFLRGRHAPDPGVV